MAGEVDSPRGWILTTVSSIGSVKLGRGEVARYFNRCLTREVPSYGERNGSRPRSVRRT